jgi:uncharacterized membrane protein
MGLNHAMSRTEAKKQFLSVLFMDYEREFALHSSVQIIFSMRLPFLPALFMAALLFSSCQETWTDESKTQFRAQCATEASGMYGTPEETKAYCDCNLEVTMKHFKSSEDLNENPSRDSAAVRKALEDCSVKARR